MARLLYSSSTTIAPPRTTVRILTGAPPAHPGWSGQSLPLADLQSADGRPIAGQLTTTPSGELPEFFGPEGDVATLYALLPDGTTITLTLAPDGAGGRGTSSAPSATGIGSLDSDNSPPVVVTAGTAPHIDFTGATITSGEDYWGVPGSALPLALGVNGSGWAVLPEGEATYTTQTFLRLTCDPADAGRMVGLSYEGNDNDNHTWAPVRADGLWEAYVQCPDRVFLGDTSPLVVITLHGEHLTVDATYTQGCSLVVYKVP